MRLELICYKAHAPKACVSANSTIEECVVSAVRLELTRFYPLPPQSSASTNSATSIFDKVPLTRLELVR